MMHGRPWPEGPASKDDLVLRARYITGFCGAGQHEGLKPKSRSGKPMKVCTAIDICNCECHVKISSMYRLVPDMERPLIQNPDYVPATPVDLSWTEAMRLPAVPFDPTPTDTGDAGENPATAIVEPNAWTTDATPAPTGSPIGRSAPLEAAVKRICDQKMRGEITDTLTPRRVGELINPDNPPSAGAIGAVFERWQKIGFAAIAKKPTRLVSYTAQGMRLGLDRMKADAAASRKRG